MSQYYGRNIVVLRQMLYSRGKDFKNFENITEEDKKRILELVSFKKKTIETDYYEYKNGEAYRSALEYLTHSSVYKHLKSFDEKIFYLINLVDPDLQAYYTYIQSEITAKREIQAAEDPKDAERLKEIRNQQLSELEETIRKQLGFYDANLLKYEEKYRQAFVKEDHFIENVKVDYITSLLELLKYIKGFNSTSDERYQALNEKAQMWLSKVSNPKDANSLAYNIFKQNHLLNLRNIAESLTFFILAFDPELQALRIYEEESTMPKMEERSIAELGFYNPNLIKAERMYHTRFTPEMVVSDWTL